MTDEQRSLANRAWVPFGGGARSCIGFALAQIELTILIARMAQRLDLHPTSTAIPPPTGLVVSRPRGGAPMLVATRQAAPITTAAPVGEGRSARDARGGVLVPGDTARPTRDLNPG